MDSIYYKLLVNIGCAISTIILAATYFISIKNMQQINERQKTFKKMIYMSIIALAFETFIVVGYDLESTLIYTIAWKISLILKFTYIHLTYKYLRDTFELKKDNTYNLYLIYLSLSMIFILVFSNPPTLIEDLAFSNGITSIFYIVNAIILSIFYYKFIKQYVKNNKKLEDREVRALKIPCLTNVIILILDALLPETELFGITVIVALTTIYYSKENYYLLVIKEINALKKSIEKSSNSKLDFLFNMSHDLRSPMNAIVGLSQSFRDDGNFDEESIRKDIKSIKYSCTTLVDIINNILDVNKIAKGNEELHEKDYNLNKLLGELPGIIETRIGNRPIKLFFNIDQNIPCKLYGDTVKIYRVILNILTNSVKYTEVGRITLTINGKRVNNNEVLSIKISDTGYGIKEEDYKKMFTKFNRLDDATDNEIEGTGLGLVITKKYVDMMGGKIWFDSIYNAGTNFYIELPQRILDETPLSSVQLADIEEKINLIDCTGKKALIIDNNISNQKTTEKILQKYNFQVTCVDDVEQAIFKIKSEEEYEIIFVDHSLSDKDGMEIANIIKNLDGYKKPIVIAFTSNVMEGIKEQYIKSGFDAYLSKPINMEEFNSTIIRYLK